MAAWRNGLVLSGLFLAGCTVGPDFEKPSSWSPESWFSAPEPAAPQPPAASRPVAEPVKADWWTLFGDAELTALEQRVEAANLDIRAATLRLAESRAQRRITAADQFPQINGDASYVREKPSARGEFSLFSGAGGGASSGGGASGIPSPGPIPPFNLYQWGFDASWELDLWGRVRRSVEGADASIEASAEARRDTLLSTMAEVARDYIQLRGVQTQLRIARENRDVAVESLRLTEDRAGHGLTSELDVRNARAELLSIQATIPQLEQRQAEAINQLGFLFGEPPRALLAELQPPGPVPPMPPAVPIGLPSELAERRPDIREAEAKLHAQTAEIGVAVAAFYPSVTLNGSDDLQALKFGNLANWASHTYSFGPSISLPIFEGGRLKGNLELTKAEQQEAAIEFERTVLNAWQEVDNALTAYDEEQHRGTDLTLQVEQTRQALDLARQQYRSGLATFLQVLDAQRQMLSAEQQQADSLTTASTNLVSLYKALGGGWPEKTADKDAG
ncbi:MAG TPA: efflux transporter outer membrane subunit [Aliidongia sp.]|nr:efflux transporter outer membrane subunit [Aliidongia sp.]